MANEKDEAGSVVPEEQQTIAAKKSPDPELFLSSLFANTEAQNLNFYLDSKRAWLEKHIEPQLNKVIDPNLTEQELTNAAHLASAATLLSVPYSEKIIEANADLEKELKGVLELLPEDQRAAYAAGFLRHHDLIKTQGPNGSFVYERNPDEPQAQLGNYIPAAAIQRDRTPQ